MLQSADRSLKEMKVPTAQRNDSLFKVKPKI